jgi:hypothetical protein
MEDFLDWDKQCLIMAGTIAPMKQLSSFTIDSPLELSWSHFGARWRATLGPDVDFERATAGDVWSRAEPSEDVIASGAVALDDSGWRRYLEFLRADERIFLGRFNFGRLGALQVILRCPGLLSELAEVPTLTAFLANHASLRGAAGARWEEVSAIYERSGIFGVLEWLGLPASRQTLSILQQITDPDLPRRLLEPLRISLWEPEGIWLLRHAGPMTDRQLSRHCNALAA